MATEDITVVHRNIPTAYFDIKNRILACPTFKDDISNELYDLFMGHEVGHALHTPYEGVHSALEKNRTLKGYLNVVEDVRIESAIKDKFAGLRRSFYTAYNELMERDFFGIKDRNLQELSLIDKINLITKVGSRVSIQLTDIEQEFLDKCYACKTWEDVERVAKEIYEWSKENETRDETDESLVPQSIDINGDEDEDEDGTESEMDWDSEENDEDDMEGDTLPDLNMEGEESTEDSEENAQEGESDSNDESKPTGSYVGGKEGGYGTYDDEDGARESITEHNAHNNEGDYISDVAHIKSQIDLPKIFKDKKEKIKNIEVSYKDVLKDWRTYWNKEEDKKRKLRGAIAGKHLVDKNKKLVAHMSKEFEMKQTAQRSKFATTGKTGKLDMNRLAKYQIVDDVFKRALYLPEGQNHGVNVMLDWSGSIANEAQDLLEQTIILAMFCRKSNIPHRMYLFTDSYTVEDRYDYTRDDANLLTIASDEMSNREWTEMLLNLGILWTNFTFARTYRNMEKVIEKWNGLFGEVDMKPVDQYYTWFDTYVHPTGYRLGGTPLDQTLVAMRNLLPKFNKQYNIEKSILTVITDGYSHRADLLQKSSEEIRVIEDQRDDDNYWRTPVSREIIDPYSKRVYDFEIGTSSYYGSNSFRNTANLLDWLSKECGVIVTGYFVLGKKRDIYNLMSDATDGQNINYDVDDVWKNVRKTGYVLNCHGYNKLFITSASAISVEGSDELDDELVDAKKTRVLAAFKKNQKSKNTSRFLTNEFIKEIA